MPQISIGNADGPLASLEFNTKYEITSFPEDLSESPYFIIFRANKQYRTSDLVRRKEGDTQSNKSSGDFLSNLAQGLVDRTINKVLDKALNVNVTLPSHSFALPIPSNLVTQYKSNYSSPSIGIGGQFAAKIAGGDFKSLGQGFVQSLIDETTQQIKAEDLSGAAASLGIQAVQANLPTLIGAAVSSIGLAGLGAAGENLVTGALAGARIARNPHIANVFEGVDFRTHSFSYKLIARSEKESNIIRNLIRNFKFHMAPSYRGEQGDHIFDYPSEFEIQLRAGDYLFQFGNSVLESFTVNYTGEGQPYFFESTNAPYNVTIDMQFKETSIVTQKEIRKGR